MSIRRSGHRIRSVVNRDNNNAAAIFFVSIGQWCAIEGQLDVMEAAKRPWIRATVTAVKPVIFSDWNGSNGINVPIKLDLKNYGDAPAVNVRIFPQIAQHPGNPRRRELDAPQQSACASARAQADENAIGGIAIFPRRIPIGRTDSGRIRNLQGRRTDTFFCLRLHRLYLRQQQARADRV
jgi:hypothetical protein